MLTRAQSKKLASREDNNEEPIQALFDEEEEDDLPIIPKAKITKLMKEKGVEIIYKKPLTLFLPSPDLLSYLLPDKDPAMHFAYDVPLTNAQKREIRNCCLTFAAINRRIDNHLTVNVRASQAPLHATVTATFPFRSNIDQFIARIQDGHGLRNISQLPRGTFLGEITVIYGNLNVLIHIFKI